MASQKGTKGSVAMLEKVKASQLFTSIAVIVVVALGAAIAIEGEVFASHYHNEHQDAGIVQTKVDNANMTAAATAKTTPKPSSTATTSSVSAPTTTAPTPSVPQTATNNQALNEECANAQNAYDTASAQTESATWTAIQGAEALESSEPLSQVVTQENQIDTQANSALSEEYSTYLAAIHAIPGCAVDFQPTSYPLTPVPSD